MGVKMNWIDKIIKNNSKTEIIVSLIILIMTIGAVIPWIVQQFEYSNRMACGKNLSKIGNAMLLYAYDNNAFPDSNKWCDILISKKYADESIFKCPSNKKEKCGYSINPNCEPNSEPNTVLVFESKGGWNSYGSEVLFVANRHSYDGGNILFSDGHVMFVSTDPNGHFRDELNWGEKNKGRGLK
jgi:prepilin-type processing-associated H-X9-DG protein